MIFEGNSIKIKNKDKFVSGKILQPYSAGNECYWWVEFVDGDKREVSVFTETELINWNVDKDCHCGSKTLNSSRHSYYCPSFTNE